MFLRNCAALGLLFCSPARRALADPADAFGVRESVQDISLSPDGRRIAYLAPHQGQGSRLYTVDLATGQSTQTTAADGRIQRLGHCGWVSAERLVCTVFALRRVQTDVAGGEQATSRWTSDGSDIVVLGGGQMMRWRRSAEPETVLMTEAAVASLFESTPARTGPKPSKHR